MTLNESLMLVNYDLSDCWHGKSSHITQSTARRGHVALKNSGLSCCMNRSDMRLGAIDDMKFMNVHVIENSKEKVHAYLSFE